MPKAPYFFFLFVCLFGFFWFRVDSISLNLIALVISIETEASLLALAKSIYYVYALQDFYPGGLYKW